MELQEKLFAGTLIPDRDWWHTLWPDPAAAVRALGISAGMTVLDLCCGDGYFTAAIARQVGAGRVVGVDLDPVMLVDRSINTNTYQATPMSNLFHRNTTGS